LIIITPSADENLCFYISSLITLRKKPLKNNRNIEEKNVQQFQTKIDAWKQLLKSRMDENVLLKSRLSDILKNNFDQSLLEEIEEFQTRFIKEDELINSLRRDVNDLDNLLYSKMFEEGKMGKSLEIKMEQLGEDIAHSVISFRILQTSFDDFQYKKSMKREN
jgi:hypothetical protein